MKFKSFRKKMRKTLLPKKAVIDYILYADKSLNIIYHVGKTSYHLRLHER